MSAEAALSVHTWRVGRYTVTMTTPVLGPGVVAVASCEWDPYLPSRLTDAESEQYQRGFAAAVEAALQSMKARA
jgi:hypothetical protein